MQASGTFRDLTGCSLYSPTHIHVDTHLPLPHLPLAVKTLHRVQLLTNLKLHSSISVLKTALLVEEQGWGEELPKREISGILISLSLSCLEQSGQALL